MRRIGLTLILFVGLAVTLLVGPWRIGTVRAVSHDDDDDAVTLRDDCNPADPNWVSIGGCTLRQGDVTRAEFDAFVTSPLSVSTVGHPAWRFQPSYLKSEPNASIRVTNNGGRVHTFTEVANFGGGRVPALNQGLTPAPECGAATDLPPGARSEVTGLSVGNHRFQCCIHPWMRTLIKVKPEESNRENSNQ